VFSLVWIVGGVGGLVEVGFESGGGGVGLRTCGRVGNRKEEEEKGRKRTPVSQ